MTAGPITPDEADALFEPLAAFTHLVLAVSGGADSTALMYLAARWAARRKASPELLVVTIDHGLRPDSAAEAAHVARLANGKSLAHRTLRWTGDKPSTGLQAAAREARYALLLEAANPSAAAGEPTAIVTAHTADDQAETVLMRLARGSGVDGLAGIPPVGRLSRRSTDGHQLAATVLRPLLGISRDRLRATLLAASIPFVEDPSNRDDRFERVRIRNALAHLAPLGITGASLARTASRMQAAKSALEDATNQLVRDAVRIRLELIADLDRGRIVEAPAEIGVRLLRRAITWAGGAAPPAELTSVESAYERLFARSLPPAALTLGGAIIEPVGADCGRVLVYREPSRGDGLPTITVPPGGSVDWDERVRVTVDGGAGRSVTVGPIGVDLPALIAAHLSLAKIGLPADALRGLPAFRTEGRIAAVPMLARYAAAEGDALTAASLAGPPSAFEATPVNRLT